jgi:dinuclear metal center YbgI/SA1388 family protein
VVALERIAPTRFAASWDNVGLIAGDPEQAVTRAMLAIDCTREVLAEAARARCELVLAYHPPVFKGIQRVVAGSIAYEAVRRGVAIWSPHTALDVADGGTNDLLADALGLVERAPLRASAAPDREYKLVTFVPAESVDAVSRALFDAGAGWIGKYSSCSFRAPGTGTFFGEQGASPVVGQAGRLELAPEVRLETVVPVARAAEVVRALRVSHPYEEPAFDLVRLAAPPEPRGLGRIGRMEAAPRGEVIARVKRALGVDHVLVAGPRDESVERAAACAGSCGDLLDDAIAGDAQLYLTGEMRHHDALRAAAAGVTVVCALHSASERAVLARVEARMRRELPGVEVLRSAEDCEPFAFV